MKNIRVGKYLIGTDCPPFIIGEMSGNHNQSLERALKIVRAVAASGASALKLQTYTADTMTLNIKTGNFVIKDPKSLWKGNSLYNLYQKAYTPWEWHKPIFDLCRKLGIVGFSTPFDSTSIDFLEKLDVPMYKISSFENGDIPLIKKAASTGKPLIISTGMATESEISEAVQAARDAGCKKLILLKCTSSYPADPHHSNLKTLPHMQERFKCQVGLSDHTLGIGVALASISLGSTVIEKHVTLKREEGGVDAAFSLEPAELKLLVEEGRKAWRASGKIFYGPTKVEKKSLQFKRSLFVGEDMKKGDIFNKKNLRSIRPGFGLPVKFFDQILGKKVVCDVKKGTPLKWKIVLKGKK